MTLQCAAPASQLDAAVNAGVKSHSKSASKSKAKKQSSVLRSLLNFVAVVVVLHVLLFSFMLAVYIHKTGTFDLWYRLSTTVTALVSIMRLPLSDVSSYVDSYQVFGTEKMGQTNVQDKQVVDYYRVINRLCALGEVEKMYIPPVLTMNTGVYGNQLLFEQEMVQDLNIVSPEHLAADRSHLPQLNNSAVMCTSTKQMIEQTEYCLTLSQQAKDAHKLARGNQSDQDLSLSLPSRPRVLELGCGRGRIAQHVASLSGAHITGVNLDDGVQIESAISFANAHHMLHSQLDFVKRSYNDLPLPFDNDSFDAFYHVQALTYVQDLDKLLSELHRVLKPKARLSFLDWFVLDAYDGNNETHRQLLERTKALIGAVYTPRPIEYEAALERNGFRVLKSQEASLVGHQYPLIQRARDFFMPLGYAVKWLASVHLLPQATDDLLSRLNLYVDDFIESDRLGLFTTSYWIVAEKI